MSKPDITLTVIDQSLIICVGHNINVQCKDLKNFDKSQIIKEWVQAPQ